MAQPVKLQLPPRDPKKELLEQLANAPAAHAAALLDAYELIQKLHEYHVFETARGLLGGSSKMVEAIAEGAAAEPTIRATRNGMILAKMLASIDPDLMQSVASAVTETFGAKQNAPEKPPGIFALLLGFARADQRRGIFLASNLLQNLGFRLKLGKRADDPQHEKKVKR